MAYFLFLLLSSDCSLRIAYKGCSVWTFGLWSVKTESVSFGIVKILEVPIYYAQKWLEKNFLSSYFYSTALSSLILPNPLKKLSARILPMSSFWTEGGFTLALFWEAWRPLDHFCSRNWIFFPTLITQRELQKDFGLKPQKDFINQILPYPFTKISCSGSVWPIDGDAYKT